MKHRTRWGAVGAAALCTLAVAARPAADVPRDERPNLVLVLADDLGYSDLGCYGGEIDTPRLDGLAANGLRFTRFYTAARCCPSRAAILTGRYPHQAGVGHMIADFGEPAYRGSLDEHCVTLAEALRGAGYATLMTGKWHVGSERGTWPTDRGFERYYGTPSGGGVYFRSTPRSEDVVFVDGETEVELRKGFYATDAFTTHANRFVEEAVDAGKPFFLYVAHFAPHWPLQAKRKDIEKYEGRYREGWDEVRRQRYERQVELGVIPKRWPLSKRDPESSAWKLQPKSRQNDLAQRMSVYAAQVDCLDQNVGRLVDKLTELEVFDNTLFVFLSDNGADAIGGIDGLDLSERKNATPGTGAYVRSAGAAWANVSDAPFREFKTDTFEGGIATPFLVHWPNGFERHGELEREVGHVIDLMPTFLDVAGVRLPTERDGAPVPPLEGRSLLPLLRGESLPERALFWEHEGNRAVRRGDWKAVRPDGTGWSLFDMHADGTETEDVAAEHEDVLRELQALYDAWSERVGVQPWPEVLDRWRRRQDARSNDAK